MKTYNLKLTSKQMYLIQEHIYDLCNIRFRENLSDYTQNEFCGYDPHDRNRINIYFKSSKVGESYIFRELTESELLFISDEIRYHVINGFGIESSETGLGNRIIKNVTNLMDVMYQRNLILEELFG